MPRFVPSSTSLVNNPVILAISTTLQAQNATFLALANKTAYLDNQVQKLKAIHTQLDNS